MKIDEFSFQSCGVKSQGVGICRLRREGGPAGWAAMMPEIPAHFTGRCMDVIQKRPSGLHKKMLTT